MPNAFLAFSEFPQMTDRQVAMLCLFKLTELQAEVRAVSSLLLQDSKIADATAKFDKLVDKAHEAALVDLIEHARQMLQPPQRPDTN